MQLFIIIIIIIIIIFNRGNRKFVHFNPRFYQALEASCWQPYWILYRSPIIVSLRSFKKHSRKNIRIASNFSGDKWDDR